MCVRVENMAKQLKTVSYSRRLYVVVFGACAQRTVTSSRSVDCLVYAFLFVLRPAHIPDVHYAIIHANISQIVRVRGSAPGVRERIFGKERTQNVYCSVIRRWPRSLFDTYIQTNYFGEFIDTLIHTKIAGKCCMLQASMPMNSINFPF